MRAVRRARCAARRAGSGARRSSRPPRPRFTAVFSYSMVERLHSRTCPWRRVASRGWLQDSRVSRCILDRRRTVMTSSSRMLVIAMLGSALVLPPGFGADSGSEQSNFVISIGMLDDHSQWQFGDALYSGAQFRQYLRRHNDYYRRGPQSDRWILEQRSKAGYFSPASAGRRGNEPFHVSVVCRYPVPHRHCESNRTTNVGRHI